MKLRFDQIKIITKGAKFIPNGSCKFENTAKFVPNGSYKFGKIAGIRVLYLMGTTLRGRTKYWRKNKYF